MIMGCWLLTHPLFCSCIERQRAKSDFTLSLSLLARLFFSVDRVGTSCHHYGGLCSVQLLPPSVPVRSMECNSSCSLRSPGAFLPGKAAWQKETHTRYVLVAFCNCVLPVATDRFCCSPSCCASLLTALLLSFFDTLPAPAANMHPDPILTQ